jgi:hypothetical protein
MATIKNPREKINFNEDVEKLEHLLHCQWDCKIGLTTMGGSMEVPQKIKGKMSISAGALFLGTCARELKAGS